jgi:hypothetical protein
VSRIVVPATRDLDAPPGAVWALLRDYREGRPRILPPQFSGYAVEEGGEGAGTVFRYTLRAARRERAYRMRVEEPAPGRELVEADTGSSLRTSWTVEPLDGGRSRVTVTTSWAGAGGVGGFFERTFAPRGVRGVYEQVLERLARAVAA